ncbi:MAG: DNA polymerase III subunit delta [Thermoleophilia bacterium]|nr:DNA polymerase III subunit delta [Thermoleophilia bacterium]
MSSEPLGAVYLLLGSDRPKIRRALARLRARFPPESVESLSAESGSGHDAVAACNALGLFGGGDRLVVVDDVQAWGADDAEAVADYVAAPSPGTTLALVAGGALKAPALAEACERAGGLLRFDVPKPRDASVWARGELERLGVRADADAVRALVESVGDDVVELASEIEKLATWAGDEPVTRLDVERLAVPVGETFVWSLTDAWGARDTGRVLAACEALLERRTKEPFVVAAALASYVGRVRAAGVLGLEGLGAAEVGKRLRIKEYPARKALQHARNYTTDELDGAVVRLAELDAALKGASRVSAELELERALVHVTEPAPAPARG